MQCSSKATSTTLWALATPIRPAKSRSAAGGTPRRLIPQSVDAGAGALSIGGAVTKETGGGLVLAAQPLVAIDGDVVVSGGGDLTLEASMIDAAGSLTSTGGAVIYDVASGAGASVVFPPLRSHILNDNALAP